MAVADVGRVGGVVQPTDSAEAAVLRGVGADAAVHVHVHRFELVPGPAEDPHAGRDAGRVVRRVLGVERVGGDDRVTPPATGDDPFPSWVSRADGEARLKC